MRRLLLGLAILSPLACWAAPNSSTFVPEHLRIPIRMITLDNSSGTASAPLYTCAAGTEGGCLVDVTNNTELNLLVGSTATIPTGVYDRVSVYTCMEEGHYHAQLEGEVSLGGRTFYTVDTPGPGADPLTLLPSASGYITVPFDGCRRSYNLPSAISVAAGDSLQITLTMPLVGIAWASLEAAPIPSGCLENAPRSESVCMAYPDVMPSVGPGAVTLERYYIIDDGIPSDAGGLVLLLTDDAGHVLGGATRRYYSESSVPTRGAFDTPFKTIASTGSAYALANFGATAEGPSYVTFPHFLRGTHAGNYFTVDGATVSYLAFRNVAAELPSCGTGPTYDFSPVILDTAAVPPSMRDFQGLVPLGNLNPPLHVYPTNHNYFYYRPDPSDSTLAVTSTLGLPSDAWITRIESEERVTAGVSAFSYKVSFSACREVQSYYDHIVSLAPTLSAALAAAGPGLCEDYVIGVSTSHTCGRDMKVFQPGGSAIGTVGGLPLSTIHAVDFGSYDARIPPLAFANPSRYLVSPDGFDGLHAVCGFGYFTPGLRTVFDGLMGTDDGGIRRTMPPICGQIMQDQPGTAQGNWYNPAYTGHDDGPGLALVHDNINPTLPAISMGRSFASGGFPSGSYNFAPSSSGGVRRDFLDVTNDGTVYCYDGLTSFGSPVGARLFIQLVDPSTLRVQPDNEPNCGSGPWDFSPGQYIDFER